jgi:hypothetical protein
MAAVSKLVAREEAMRLSRRNWAAQEAGVVLVFVLVFIVILGTAIGCGIKYWNRYRVRKRAREGLQMEPTNESKTSRKEPLPHN